MKWKIPYTLIRSKAISSYADSSNYRTTVRSHFHVKFISGKALGRSYRVWTSVYNQFEWEACLPIGFARPGGVGVVEFRVRYNHAGTLIVRNAVNRVPGLESPRGGFDFEKSHRDDGRAIIIDRNCVWKRVPRARPRALDYKRYCGIVTGDGRGRAVDRTVDRLIIALYSRTKPPDIFASLFRRYLFIFSTGDRPPPPTRLPLASHLPAGIAQPAIRPGSNLTITFPLRRLSGLFFPFYRFLVRFFRSPSCYLHKVPVEITHSPGSFRQKNWL